MITRLLMQDNELFIYFSCIENVVTFFSFAYETSNNYCQQPKDVKFVLKEVLNLWWLDIHIQIQ